MTKPRLAYIDALRGFAILGVMIAHAGSLSGLSGVARDLSDFGGFGVQLFFVISAFTIFLTFEQSQASEAAPVRNFFIRRLMRIVPVYWAGIVLYTAVYGLGSRGWREGPELWHYPLHITLTNLLSPTAMSSVVPGGWSISCEVLFYLTVPIWFLLVRSVKSAAIFALACSVLSPIAIWGLSHLAARTFSHLDPVLMQQYWSRSFPSQLPCFAFGILLFYLVKSPFVGRFARPAWNLGLLILALLVFRIGMQAPPVPKNHQIYAVAFMLMGLALSQIPWALLVNKITVFIGRVSYSAYLLHFLVLHTLFRLGVKDVGSPLLRFLFEATLGIAITIPLAWLSYKLIEMPATRVAKSWISALENRRRMKAGFVSTEPA